MIIIFLFFLFSSKLINVLQTHIRNAINNKTSDIEFEELSSTNEKSSEKLLYKATKNLQYIMKFIIRSRILFANLNDDKDRMLFESSLEGKVENYFIILMIILNYFILFFDFTLLYTLDLLASFIKLIACPNDLLRSQGAILKYLHIISSDLMQVYDPLKLW